MSEKLPSAVKAAAGKFRKHRAEYFAYLSSILKSKPDTKLLSLFERDAQRYDKEPRGVLSAHWAHAYANNGSNLANAWNGTLPDDEVSIIRVAQDAGGDALEVALQDVSRISALTDKVRSESFSVMAMALLGLVISVTMLTIFPVFAAEKIKDIFSFIPVHAWGGKGKFLLNYAQAVKDYGLYVLFAVVTLVVYVQWTINNLTGSVREWLDTRIALYTMVRDIKGAMFLATMSTLTRKRGNIMFTLGQSLQSLMQSIRSPWLRWRVEQIVEGIEQSGGVSAEAFNTNLLSREMFYYLRDTQEGKGFAEGFEATGQYVEKNILAAVLKRMAVYRMICLLFSVAVAMAVVGYQVGTIHEMKGAMTMYFNSR